ncbi:MAG: hypothetical protein IKP93_03910, partial [Paludibacteraceae bacterium]|nr:hypothetical protein [Paludibacteraceae bacterium]
MKPFTIYDLRFTILAILFSLTACAKNEWQLVWNDEFEGEVLDTTYWNVEDNARGGGNAELQYYTPRNITIERHPVTGES